MRLRIPAFDPAQQRQERAWEPEVLHAPSPMPLLPDQDDVRERHSDEREREGGNVIIIDMNDYTEM